MKVLLNVVVVVVVVVSGGVTFDRRGFVRQINQLEDFIFLNMILLARGIHNCELGLCDNIRAEALLLFAFMHCIVFCKFLCWFVCAVEAA